VTDQVLDRLIEAFDARVVDEWPPLEADFVGPQGPIFCSCGDVMFPWRRQQDVLMVCLRCRVTRR
jgi:hypothetical protein